MNLIVWLVVFIYSNGVHIEKMSFNNMDSCKAAKEIILEDKPYLSYIYAHCLSNGVIIK